VYLRCDAVRTPELARPRRPPKFSRISALRKLSGKVLPFVALKPSLTQFPADPPQGAELSEPQPPVVAPPEFDALYEEWFDEVARWIRAMGGPEADREDLVQDVFLVVYRRLPDFDGKNVAGWLYQIARRRVRDFRRLFWVKHLFGPSVPLTDSLAKPGPNPADSLETKEKSQQLDEMLRALNPDQRAAFVLFEIEGYSGEEIARLQEVPLNTVWARIHKARKKLQTRIAKIEKREFGRS
jgi:RNA polymerase sigma-70 factor (ECF subfamily)